MYLKSLTYILIVAVCTVGIAFAADKKGSEPITQLDFAAKLVERFGWSEGLPDMPGENDYLTILKGSRTYRFEAEDIYDLQTDTVTVRKHDLFGPFTGRGWIHGISVPTAVHFTVFIPLSGQYTVKASTKGDGQLWSIAGRAFKINADKSLKEVVVGKVAVPSGKLEFNAVIPANGGIDYIIFSAPSLAPLEPVSGWNFAAPFTKGQLAEFRAALLGNEYLLPDDKSFAVKSISPASLSSLPLGVQVTDKQMFGKPLSQKWVRSGQVPVTVDIPFDVDAPGVYTVRARFTGSVLNAGFGLRTVAVDGKPYLDWVDLGAFRLPKGSQNLQLHLPPAGGVDLVEISRKVSSVADYFALAGLKGSPEDKILNSELEAVITALQASFKERR